MSLFTMLNDVEKKLLQNPIHNTRALIVEFQAMLLQAHGIGFDSGMDTMFQKRQWYNQQDLDKVWSNSHERV